jgi:ketosteroid isomerase-like protein
MSLERRVRDYLSAIEGGAAGDELAGFYHPDAVVHEYPNLMNPAGAHRGLAEVLAGADAGRRVLSRQMFDVHTLTESGDRVVVEMTWTGYLAAPLGMKTAGETLIARVAQVIEFEDDLIIRQRTYDCFEPF